MNFVLWAPEFTWATGGIIAIHKLADTLAELGHHSVLTSRTTVPGWKGISGQGYNVHNSVVIYPEIIHGNFLGAPMVVRWILNNPHAGGVGIYDVNDLFFLWAKRYTLDERFTSSGQLTAFRNMDFFCDFGRPRSGHCHLFRKGGGKPHCHRPDSLCVDDYNARGGDSYMREVFNARELFICYDHSTMVSEIAALCGCPTVIVPDGVNSLSTLQTQGEMLYGTAWGFDDLDRANSTRHELRDYVNAREREAVNQAKAMTEICFNRWEGRAC